MEPWHFPRTDESELSRTWKVDIKWSFTSHQTVNVWLRQYGNSGDNSPNILRVITRARHVDSFICCNVKEIRVRWIRNFNDERILYIYEYRHFKNYWSINVEIDIRSSLSLVASETRRLSNEGAFLLTARLTTKGQYYFALSALQRKGLYPFILLSLLRFSCICSPKRLQRSEEHYITLINTYFW